MAQSQVQGGRLIGNITGPHVTVVAARNRLLLINDWRSWRFFFSVLNKEACILLQFWLTLLFCSYLLCVCSVRVSMTWFRILYFLSINERFYLINGLNLNNSKISIKYYNELTLVLFQYTYAVLLSHKVSIFIPYFDGSLSIYCLNGHRSRNPTNWSYSVILSDYII